MVNLKRGISLVILVFSLSFPRILWVRQGQEILGNFEVFPAKNQKAKEKKDRVPLYDMGPKRSVNSATKAATCHALLGSGSRNEQSLCHVAGWCSTMPAHAVTCCLGFFFRPPSMRNRRSLGPEKVFLRICLPNFRVNL